MPSFGWAGCAWGDRSHGLSGPFGDPRDRSLWPRGLKHSRTSKRLVLTQAARLKDKDKKKQEQGDGRPRTGRERTLSHTAARSQASEQVTTRYTAPSPRSATTRCLRHPVFNNRAGPVHRNWGARPRQQKLLLRGPRVGLGNSLRAATVNMLRTKRDPV